jgi:hypothetical protein
MVKRPRAWRNREKRHHGGDGRAATSPVQVGMATGPTVPQDHPDARSFHLRPLSARQGA